MYGASKPVMKRMVRALNELKKVSTTEKNF
jgi:hypothetical protein